MSILSDHVQAYQVQRSEPRTVNLRMEAILLAAILVCAAAARLATLYLDHLWLDEGYTLAIARLPFEHLLTVPFDNHPPGYYGLMKLWIGDGPVSEFSLRLPSAIASILTLVPTYLLARSLMGNVGALAALAVYSFSFEELVYAGDARSYALLSLYLITSFLALHMTFSRVISSDRLRSTATYGWIALYLLSTIAAVYTHNLAVLFVLSANALFVFKLLVQRSKDWWRSALFCMLLNAPVVLVWLPHALIIPGTTGALSGWLQQPDAKTALLTTMSVVLPNWTGAWGAILALAGIVTGLALLSQRQDDLFYTVVFLILLFSLVLWAAGLVMTPVLMERTLLLTQIGGAFAIGAAVALMRSTPIAAAVFVISFIPYVASAGAYLRRDGGQDRSYGGHLVQDWGSLTHAGLGGRTKPDAVILCDVFSYPTVRFYAHEPDIWLVRSDGRLMSLTDPAWLYIYGLPVSERLSRFETILDQMEKDGRVATPSWGEIGRRYESILAIRPRIFCGSGFEELVSKELGAQGYSAARDVSKTGVIAKQFEHGP